MHTEICLSVYVICFRASYIIKHVQHNQHSHIQNGSVELRCEELLDAHQACVLGICFCYRPHSLLPWQQTEISLHPLHTSAFLHILSPPSKPDEVTTHFCAPCISRSWGNSLQSVSCRPVGWDPSRDQFRCQWVHCITCLISVFAQFCQNHSLPVWSTISWAAVQGCVRFLTVTQLCNHFMVLSTTWGGCAEKCFLWPTMQGWCKRKKDTQSHLPLDMHGKKHTELRLPNRNRITSTLPRRSLNVIGREDSLRHGVEALTLRYQTCSVQMRLGPVLDSVTYDLFPFSQLEVSEMDEDLSEGLFWVCGSRPGHLRFDISTAPGALWLLGKTTKINPQYHDKDKHCNQYGDATVLI